MMPIQEQNVVADYVNLSTVSLCNEFGDNSLEAVLDFLQKISAKIFKSLYRLEKSDLWLVLYRNKSHHIPVSPFVTD